jgi:hypothetical protein
MQPPSATTALLLICPAPLIASRFSITVRWCVSNGYHRLKTSNLFTSFPPPQAHYRGGAFGAALADARTALALDAASEKARYRAALAHMALDEASDAATHLTALAAGSSPPPDAAPLLDRATALSEHQILVEAIKHDNYTLDTSDKRLIDTKAVLEVLWAEAEGDADADVRATLQALEGSLRGSEAARAWFEAHNGYRLLWFFFTDAHCDAAAAVLRAGATSVVLWPREAWSRLLAAAVAQSDDEIGAAAMNLVVWAAGACPAWVKCQLLVAPPVGAETASPQLPLLIISKAMASCKLGVGQTKAAAALLELYGADTPGVVALRSAGAAPLQALLAAVSGAEKTCEGVADKDVEVQNAQNLPPEEAEALCALQEKRKAVYDAAAVDLRRRLLCVLRSLCAYRELILDEALVRGTGGKVGEGPLVAATLRLLGSLLDASPRRTAPVLGPDGSVVSYEKRPFAADWKDNPAGDFLATLDLGSGGGSGSGCTVSTDCTQLELLVEAFEAICASSAAAATAAHRRGAVGVCVRLAEFLTPSVGRSGQRIAALLAQKCPKALEEVLRGDSVALTVGLAVHLPESLAEARARAFDKLAGISDSCSGNEFAGLTGLDGALAAALAAATGGGPAAKPGARLLQLCADRALRQGNAGHGGKIPRGGGWDGLNVKTLRSVLSPAAPKAAAAEEDEGLGNLKKGFLPPKPASFVQNTDVKVAPPSRRPPPPATPAPQPPSSPRASYYRGGVVIEELNDEQSTTPAAATEAALPNLRTVYDSSPSDAAIRQSRAAWLALPPSHRQRWEQTAGDVSVWVTVPAGTAAADITVHVTPDALVVRLKWYGNVLEGRLRGRVKAREAAWCLEAPSKLGAAIEKPEIHISLPKDGSGTWWKALFEGDQEKGYLEILKEAVEADDPEAAAAELGPEARELVEALRERQALVNAGMIDLENRFDDFRIVLGEESLKK